MNKFIFKLMRFISLKFHKHRIRFLLKNNTLLVFGSPDIVFEDRITIGDNCSINYQVYINGMGGIKIGNNVSISAGVKIISTGLDISSDKKEHQCNEIIIKDNVWIGAGAIILSGVVIGENSIVGAGSLVNKNINKNEIHAGVPAKLIKIRNDN